MSKTIHGSGMYYLIVAMATVVNFFYVVSNIKAVAADVKLFNDMTTTWKFTPNVPRSKLSDPSAADHPTCWIDFDISFDFASPLHAQASSVFFDQVSKMTLQAFVDRCHTVYKK